MELNFASEDTKLSVLLMVENAKARLAPRGSSLDEMSAPPRSHLETAPCSIPGAKWAF